MNPEEVNPGNFQVERILYTSPEGGGFSVAVGIWTEDNMRRLAVRWNGDIEDPNSKGYPTSHTHPMWFQLPYDLNDLIEVLSANQGLSDQG